MVTRTTQTNLDTLARAIPGQSLTDEPGKNPYERPASIVSPKEAMDNVVQSLQEDKAKENVLQLLDAGISSETIASSLVLKMFSEGVFSPDVAEIIKPPLVSFITDMGVEEGIEDINVVNELPKEAMSDDAKLNIMSKLNPAKHQKIMDEDQEFLQENELASMIDFSEEEEEQEQEGEEMMEAPVESNGSFIDREAV